MRVNKSKNNEPYDCLSVQINLKPNPILIIDNKEEIQFANAPSKPIVE
jgi:hypothetical protein